MGLIVTVSVTVPMCIDVEVESGQTIEEAVEQTVHNIAEDIDGTPTIHNFSCSDLEGVSIDDTIYECSSCGEFGTDELCEDCSEDEKE